MAEGATPVSGTATVLFTDLVGSTELLARLGEVAADGLRRVHDGLLTDAIGAHRGTVVKGLGDGIMASFNSAADAVTAAVTIQQSIDRHNRRTPEQKLAVRVGVGVGDVSWENGDCFGVPVIEAARLCAVANGGQILVTDLVRAMARSRGGHVFASVGELALKGLPEPLPACEVRWEPLAGMPPSGVPLPPRITKAPLGVFGRGAESEMLAAAWRKAKDGQRQVILLAGEPGIGKTRLAMETALAVHAEEAVVLLGTCDEDVNLPYQPFVEALRHYVAHAPDKVLAAHVREHKGELVRLAPELARRIPDLPAPQVAEAETERYLLFEAVTGLLSVASQRQPIFLILDDLHWAGVPELLLLKHILKTAKPLRLLIIGTYRDTDLTRAHPLTAVLADLRRESGVQRVALHGLDEAAVVRFVTAAAGHELTEPGIALARALHDETEGSPLFLGEILRNLRESGAIFQEGDRWTYRGDIAALAIPEGIKEVIGRRLNRLSEPTNKVLSLAAVIGRQFDVALLARIADISEDALLDALDEAAAAALVAEVPGTTDRYAFNHALIRTTLYEELNTARRARLHRRVGEALEKLTAANPWARIDELAHHWLATSQVADVAKAVRYARQAGDQALAGLAYEEAAAHYERALAVFEATDRESELLRCDLLLALGGAQRSAGDAKQRRTMAEAAALARRHGDVHRLGLAALGSGRPGGAMSSDTVDDTLVGIYAEAIDELGSRDDLLRARLLGQLAVELVYGPERERRHALSAEALAIARRVGDRLAIAQAIIARLYAISDPTTLDERLALTAELEVLANEFGSLELSNRTAYHRALALLESGDAVGAALASDRCEELATQLHVPFFSWSASFGRAVWSAMRGAPDAERQALEAFQMGRSIGLPHAGDVLATQLSFIRFQHGQLGAMADEAQAGARSSRRARSIGSRVVLSLVYCETDRLDEAKGVFEQLAADGFDVPLDWMWVGWMFVLAEVCAVLHDRRAAELLYARLRPLAEQVGVAGGFCYCVGSLGHAGGVLAACLERWDDAERHFEHAVAMNDRIGARPAAASTRRAYAAMLLDRDAPGDRARAAELIAAGRAEAEQLGMARELVRFERLQARSDERKR